MIRVGIAGATGYTGAELVRILSNHPNVKITILTSRQNKGVPFDRVFPAMSGICDLICEEFSITKICDNSDVVFMALPHKLPMGYAPEILKAGKKVIDLSADFRFNDPAKYEKYYEPHVAKELLKDSVYGLCEIYFEKIKDANLIGNPGCYPTTVLLPLIPLLKSKLIDKNSIIVDSKSGVSGAGRSPSLTSLYCEATESFKAYKIGNHRHTPEMEEILSKEAGENVSITFTPHLVPMSRGMLSTIYATLSDGIKSSHIRDCLSSFYKARPFIRIKPDGMAPDTLHVRGTNYCDIGFKLDERKNRIIIISVIDNLVKGASGQAVQNMNIMFGIDEACSLKTIPFPV
ncbi:MAG: N-acetyl-gamma-glutamyl-phosphate reductase [Desulfobacterales bacterium]|nr:N-acetyl-gamma-glutamyl-phosphate reductase [Desulfobacterales bacterium]